MTTLPAPIDRPAPLLGFSACAWLLAAAPGFAAESPAEPEVVVTSTRLPAILSATPGAYVIDRQDIETRQLGFVTQALQGAPGLTVSSAGMFGVVSVRQRGAGADKTLVLIDGVPVNDPSQPQGGFDFAGLDIETVERIEVLSGPQGALWGSDAIGGVISIASREADGLRAGLEGGAFGTVRGSAAAGRSTERWALGLTASEIKSDGVSAADVRNRYAGFGFPALRNGERDGLRDRTVAAHARFSLSDTVRIDGLARYNDARADIDGYPFAAGFLLSDTDDAYRTRSKLGRVRLMATGPLGLENELSFSAYHLKRAASGESGPYGYSANRRVWRWTAGRGGAGDRFSFQAGAERTDNRASLSTGVRADLSVSSAFVVARIRPTERLTVTVSGRYEDPDSYEAVATGRVAASLKLGGGLSVEGSFGQGFKTPTISETACDFCFAPPLSLKPEHAEGFDLGLSWNSADGRVLARAAVFRTEVRDQIAYANLRYVNIARARSRGAEFSLEAAVGGGFRLEGAYTHVDAIDETTGRPLLRTPRSSGLVSLSRRSGRFGGALTVRAEGSRSDTDLDGFSLVTRPGFAVADLAGDYALNGWARVTARIENISDRRYQETYGFGVPGRAVYVGLKLAR